ncbi:putative rub1-conjugating enzyme e2 [Paratrimastix pyriformis]|uniref:Rub1-conjugating enzyme e2 n=1 Tax=Paratrimastix pyriformis TaxID=342808 RepID=A0ABQ8USA6_9EUKA|nr:putative rub1-conjugating enzyme e2 [Paratrimastix pyriformis]
MLNLRKRKEEVAQRRQAEKIRSETQKQYKRPRDGEQTSDGAVSGPQTDGDVSAIVRLFQQRRAENERQEAAPPPPVTAPVASVSHKCLQMDFTSLEEDLAHVPVSIHFSSGTDLHNFVVRIHPPTGCWAGGEFDFLFNVPPTYRFDPPKVRCITKPIYHPNISPDGDVCLSILREAWSPVMNIQACIFGLLYLFHEPNSSDPLNHEAGELMATNPAAFRERVRRSLMQQRRTIF